MDPNVVGAILGWMPVVAFTELIKRKLKVGGGLAVAISVVLSGAASILYLVAVGTFTWPWFFIIWIAVASQANGLFQAFHSRS